MARDSDAGRARGLPGNGRALPTLCSRQSADAVARLFCADEPPGIGALYDLVAQLGLRPEEGLLVGHSTALGGKLVSAINPRVIFVPRVGPGEGFVFLAFIRGQQRVEAIALDPNTERLNLYVVEFEQDCNDRPAGCSTGDLFTPEIERGWHTLRIFDDEDLKNTPSDCRRCHGGSPGVPGPMLLMRELRAPWMHWFRQLSPQLDDYASVKGDELIGGLGANAPRNPGALESIIGGVTRSGHQGPQPLDFPSGIVAFETGELISSTGFPSERGATEPSPTWRALYDAFRAGQGIAPPYHREQVTDPAKLAAIAKSYRALAAGQIDGHELADLANVHPDDPHLRAEIGLAVEPDASAPELLQQACAPCHNASFDPSISRANFDVDLDRMSTESLERAIERLQLPPGDPSIMPPADARELPAAARARLVEFLERRLR